MEQKILLPNHNYKVLIRCNTFNQSKFIKETLTGFTIQETNFPYICLIIDDCSTDGEPEVIKEFLRNECVIGKAILYDTPEAEVIIVSHKNNKNCTFAIYFLKENFYSQKKSKNIFILPWENICKYEAICEGDDYWIDSNKLQKQVDFLDTHKSVSCAFHRFQIFNEDSKESFLSKDPIFDKPENKDVNYYLFNNEYNILKHWTSKTLTIVYRLNLINNETIANYKYRRDVHIVYYLLKKGQGVCMNFVGGVYRVNSNGIFGSKSVCEQNHINALVYKEFSEKEDDYLLKEAYYRFLDYYMFHSHHGLSLFLYRVKRRIRNYCNKKKRIQLYNKIEPKL